MWHTVPQPVPFAWQCVMRYHDHCISPGNVLCGTTTNVYIKSVGNINYDFYTPAPPEGAYCFTSVRSSVRLSFRPYKICFVAFFSATIDGRNLIFGHKLHIGISYCGKRLWARQIPTSCLPT